MSDPNATGTTDFDTSTQSQPQNQGNVDPNAQQQPPQSSGGPDYEGEDDTEVAPPPGEEYPPQKHAGAVGYGPEYGEGAGLGDKFDGFKEQLKGKMTGNQDLVQHGKELQTGELKKKQLEGGVRSATSANPGLITDDPAVACRITLSRVPRTTRLTSNKRVLLLLRVRQRVKRRAGAKPSRIPRPSELSQDMFHAP
jgi:hypothetical protein